MNKYVKSIIVLISICLVVAALMAAVNYITAPIILEAENSAANDSLKEVMPEGEDFKPFEFSEDQFPDTVTEIFKEKNGGYVFKLNTSGKSSGFVIMCGIDATGTVRGCKVISHSETPGYADKVIPGYADKLKGTTSQTIMGTDTVSGATITSVAYRAAVKDALDAFAILGGADVDLRTEEEILQDTIKETLPAADEFDLVFVAEVLDGVDTVYKAKNGVGFVFVCGKDFVATDAQGNVLSSVSAELSDKVKTAAEKLLASESVALDISAVEGISTRVVSVKKTLSGNYIVRVKGAGYGRDPEAYHASGEYIIIDISITPEGKIINCYTVSQAESEGYGAVCAKYKFYSQFNGKDETNYENIDAITSATKTTNGYKTAVKNALDAIKVLVREGM